ncbi:fimbrial protein [Dryocola clanedunensis]
MKFAKVALLVGMGFVGMNAANAADQGNGSVTFTGSIIDAPCSITPQTADQTVPLGQVSAAALANGGTSTPVPFTIDLENCTLDKTGGDTVSVTFDGTADATDATMLGLAGTASGAGIVIGDAGSQQIDLGVPSAASGLVEGANSLQFSAWLKGEAGASATVTPGDFQSVANFTLAYN